MKKLIVAAAAVVWAGAALAGDYHQASTLRCSECHTMHASRAHAFNGGVATDDVGWFGNPAFPNDKLLIQAGVNVTCLACHDNTAVPDVFATNESGPALNARSAGALNGTVAGHANAGYSPYMGHTLATSDAPPGFTGSWDPASEGFHCGNCHAIHGSSFFRNLGGPTVGTTSLKGSFTGVGPVYNPYDGVTPRDTTENASYDVLVTNAARSYAVTDVQFRIGGAGMNTYCGVCHGDFHGAGNTESTTPGDFIRHPTSGVAIGVTTDLPAYQAGPYVEAQKIVRPAYAADHLSGQAACLSCHKGHGNQRGFMIVLPNGLAANTDKESGDAAANAGTGVRPLCNVCHTDAKGF